MPETQEPQQTELTDAEVSAKINDRLNKLFDNLSVEEESINETFGVKRLNIQASPADLQDLNPTFSAFLLEHNPEGKLEFWFQNGWKPWFKFKNLAASGHYIMKDYNPPYLATDHSYRASDPAFLFDAYKYLKELLGSEMSRRIEEGDKNVALILDVVEKSAEQQGLLTHDQSSLSPSNKLPFTLGSELEK